MPYINFYLKALKSSSVEIHVIKWSRDKESDITMDDDIIIHDFRYEQLDETSKFRKLPNFIRFRKFVCNILCEYIFDRIIILQSLPAVLIADKLLREYRGYFILDYRDYTYENFPPFKSIVGKLVKASYATFVSSDAFREALPKLDKVYTSHNLLLDTLKHRCAVKEIGAAQHPVRIAFWGFIRHERINRILIEALGNDERFELHYYGREQQTAWNLKALVEQKHFSNVFFHGAYLPEERYTFAAQTDLIHNMYENDAGMQKAMSNKYYDGIIFRIPQICTEGSYMGERVELRKVGIAIDPYNSDFSEALYKFFRSYNRNEFAVNCDAELRIVMNQYEKGKVIICSFVDEGKAKQ